MKRAMERVFLDEGTARSKSLRQKIDVFKEDRLIASGLERKAKMAAWEARMR